MVLYPGEEGSHGQEVDGGAHPSYAPLNRIIIVKCVQMIFARGDGNGKQLEFNACMLVPLLLFAILSKPLNSRMYRYSFELSLAHFQF